VHDPLPPDLDRCLVLEVHLTMQLEVLRKRIAHLRRENSRWRSVPADSYRIQHVPGGVGLPGRGVLHRDDCWEGHDRHGRGGFDAYGARAGLEDLTARITPCRVCRPEEELYAPRPPGQEV
jgi:hypothetical protein